MIELKADKAIIKGLKKPVKSVIDIPGDKSISHRAIMLGAISKGESKIANLSVSRDNLATVSAFRKLGVKIERFNSSNSSYVVKGAGLTGFKEPKTYINTANSGTLTRLIAGMLAGTDIFSVISGDKYLNLRPMDRVIIPLRLMGAKILGRDNDKYLPLAIVGSRRHTSGIETANSLHSIYYEVPVPSAQVKSCIMLAAIFAGGTTAIYERKKTRDHTERFLKLQNYPIVCNDTENGGSIINIKGGGELNPFDITVPGDFSSAAFFLAIGLLLEGSEVTIKNVLLNERRIGLLNILKRMNANIDISNQMEDLEKAGTIKASYSRLSSVAISSADVPDMIDEFPIFAVIASFADGNTKVTGAKELRVKETDRIKAIVSNIKCFGIDIVEFEDGFEISGRSSYISEIKNFNNVKVDSYGDHRIAMSMIIMALLLRDVETEIRNIRCINTSFPEFFEIVNKLIQ